MGAATSWGTGAAGASLSATSRTGAVAGMRSCSSSSVARTIGRS